VGRTAVDFGFSGVIEKFEEHWGKRATRGLTLLIGLAVAAGSVAIIWQWLVQPVLIFFQTPIWGRTLISLFLTVVAIGGGVAVGLLLISVLGQWRLLNRAERRIAKAKHDFDEVYKRAQLAGAATDETTAKSVMLLEASIDLLKGLLERAPPEKRADMEAKIRGAEARLAEVKASPVRKR